MIPVRGLSDVRAVGDLVWFQPALDRLRALRDETDPRLREFFAPDSPVYIARAPGRLDVMGGIADYSGACVLELPLACATTALLQRQVAPRCDIATRRGERWQFLGVDLPSLVEHGGALNTSAMLAAWFAERETDHWASYVVGVVQACLQRPAQDGPGADIPAGLRLLIDSTVPEGRGVASSAALEVATGAAVSASCGSRITGPELAAACQAVENQVVGAPCGIMDQITACFASAGALLPIRCQPAEALPPLVLPEGVEVAGIDSGVRHDVGDVRLHGGLTGFRRDEGDSIGRPDRVVAVEDRQETVRRACLRSDGVADPLPKLLHVSQIA